MTTQPSVDDFLATEPLSSAQDIKIQQVFGKLAIDKRRLPMSQLQKRGVPAYVGEWLLDSVVPGSGPLTPSEAAKVQQWAGRFIPSPADTNLIKNRLLDGEIVKVLTPVQVEVELTRRRQERVAKMTLLGISDAHINDTIVQQYPDLLNQGMWGVVEVANTKEGVALNSFKPMQATVNLGLYKEARRQFNLSEWRSLMMTSMGYSPEAFTEDEQLLLLCRLLPLVQKNMHMMELSPQRNGEKLCVREHQPACPLDQRRQRVASRPVRQ